MTTEETAGLRPTADLQPAPVIAFQHDLGSGRWTWFPDTLPTYDLDPAELLARCDGDERPVALVQNARRVDPRRADGLDRPASADALVSGSLATPGRYVAVVVERLGSAGGTPTGLRGHVIDLTAAFGRHVREIADAAVGEVVENRAVIEQAKGALVLARAYDAESAFRELRAWSSRRNVKVRVLAERVVSALRGGAATSEELARRVDEVLDSASRES